MYLSLSQTPDMGFMISVDACITQIALILHNLRKSCDDLNNNAMLCPKRIDLSIVILLSIKKRMLSFSGEQ